MKTFSLLFLFCSILLHPQKFKSLDGFENQQGETILLYRFGTEERDNNPVFKFNTSTLSEELIINAGTAYPGGKRGCNDFEFFPGDDSDFMNTGYELGIDPIFFIARNDIAVQYDFYTFRGVDIDRQNPLKVYAFGNGIFRSFDGGLTFPADSVLHINYSPLSLSRCEENTFFGLNQENKLVKNGSLVDTTTIFFDSNFKIIYDADQLHIYIIYKTYWYEGIKVSADKGNSFSTKYYADSNLCAAVDPVEPGTIYAAKQKKIWKSINYGTNFFEYKELPYRIVGLYKKPGSEILYAATPGKIFAVTPDSINVIKTRLIPPDEIDWFPLAIGNRWIYWDVDCFWWHPQDTSLYVSTIVGDTIISGEKYFTFDKPIGVDQYKFIRFNSSEGKIEVNWGDYKFPIYDYFMEPGDFLDYNLLENDDSVMVFNKLRAARFFYGMRAIGQSEYKLVKGLGYYKDGFYETNAWCHETILKGCVLNGIVYGDTTVVGVEKTENIPAEYILCQNYPNPFNPNTTINYTIKERGVVQLKVYDVLAKQVATLVNEPKSQGSYSISFNGNNLPSGVYLYTLTVNDFTDYKKMILLK